MRTERMRPGRACGSLACALAVLLAAPGLAGAQGGGPAARSADAQIDVALGAIEGPVLKPLLVPPGRQMGIPPFPPFKQEPPAAQQDFRGLTSPSAAPPPNPGKTGSGPPGGTGVGGGSGSGGGVAGGQGGGQGGGQPPGPPVQLPPPNIDPTPPNVLPPPGPGVPLPPPGPFLRPARAR